jgi:hypothetical protein
MKPVRQVVKPTTHRSVGIVNASWVQPEGIPHESELEAAFVRHAILCPAVALIHAQPFKLAWTAPDGSAGSYVPDYLVTLSDRARVVVEIRPARFVDKDRVKFQAAAQQLANKALYYVVITDEQLTEPRQRAVRLVLRSARGDLSDDQAQQAVGLVRATGRDGLTLESAIATGIPLTVWHFLIGRRRLIADTGVELQPSSRLFQPQDWPGVKEHERLQFDRWFGCQAWRPDSGI